MAMDGDGNIALGYSNDLYTIQDDRIVFDTTNGQSQSATRIVEYSPVPWGEYEGFCYGTGNAAPDPLGNIIVNVNNPTVDGWMIIKQEE